MTPEELAAAVTEFQRQAEEKRQKLYRAIGRESAYMLLGGIIASAGWAVVLWVL